MRVGPFKFYHYLGLLCGPLFLFAFLFRLLSCLDGLPGIACLKLFQISIGFIVVIGMHGGILGLIWVTVGLRMRCPFCGQYGWYDVSKATGLILECDDCESWIRGTGLFKWRLTAIPFEYEEDEPDTDDEIDNSGSSDYNEVR